MADVTFGADPVTGDTIAGQTDAGRPVKIGGKAASGVPAAVTDGQRVDGRFTLTGDQGADLRRGQTVLFASVDVAASGDNTIVAADATKKIKVLSYSLVCGGTVNVRWKSGAASNLSGAMPFVVNTGISSPVATPAGGHLMETAVNNALVLNLSAAIQVSGHLSYFLEA